MNSDTEPQEQTEEDLWSDVKSIINNKLKEFTQPDFQEYDHAIGLYMEESSSLNLIKERQELLESVKKFTGNVAGKYANQFETIAQAFVHKSQVTENIERSLTRSRDLIQSALGKFALEPNSLNDQWKKCRKYEEEIKIYERIEKLVQTPSLVARLIDNGDMLEAVAAIETAFADLTSHPQMNEITALSEVTTRLNSCKQKTIDRIFEELFNELFINSVPEFSFFPNTSTDENFTSVEVSKAKMYAQAFYTLHAEGEFSKKLSNEINDRLVNMIMLVANSIKVKKRRTTIEVKSSFKEFVEISQDFTPANPLIKFIDSVLCRLWILLSRCKSIDDYLSLGVDNKSTILTLMNTWMQVDKTITELVNTFTSIAGSKQSTHVTTLEYKFISNEVAPSTQTYNSIRIQLGVKPISLNIIQLSPLIKLFREKARTIYQLNPYGDVRSTSDATRDWSAGHEILKQADNLAKEINPRPIKSDLHEVPIYFHTPIFIENIRHFVEAAAKFTDLQQDLASSVNKLLKAFNDDCEAQLIGFTANSSIYSSKILNKNNTSLIQEYQRQPLFHTLIFENNEEDIEPMIEPFAVFEESKEAELLNGTRILHVEETFRERFQLPSIATIAESLIVLHNNVTEMLNHSKFGDKQKKSINGQLDNINSTIVKCMAFLHFEMRCKCYAEVVPSLVGVSYKLQTIPQIPDPYASALATLYQSTMERLAPNLTPSRLMFVFIGIPRLVYNLHILFLPKVKEINDKGTTALIDQNIALFRNTFSTFKYPEPTMYSKTLWFISHIYLSTDRILMALKQSKKFFTYEEIAPVFQMQQKASESQAEALEALKILFNGQ